MSVEYTVLAFKLKWNNASFLINASGYTCIALDWSVYHHTFILNSEEWLFSQAHCVQVQMQPMVCVRSVMKLTWLIVASDYSRLIRVKYESRPVCLFHALKITCVSHQVFTGSLTCLSEVGWFSFICHTSASKLKIFPYDENK